MVPTVFEFHIYIYTVDYIIHPSFAAPDLDWSSALQNLRMALQVQEKVTELLYSIAHVFSRAIDSHG